MKLANILQGRTRQEIGMDVRIARFREVLHANNTALGIIAEIQESLQSTQPLTMSAVCRMVAGVTVQTFRMLSNLNQMTGNRYKRLLPRFNGLKTELSKRVGMDSAAVSTALVAPLAEIGPCVTESVGQKSAYLGEARRLLPSSVPEGFSTTARAYQLMMETDGLGKKIAAILETIHGPDVPSCFEASAQIVQLIDSCRIPDSVVSSIETAVAQLPGGAGKRFAVRSSAIQEGGVGMSFAGQYGSFLNVSSDGVVDAVRRVVASKYAPQAIAYRLGRGLEDPEIAMCCCVLTMVDAAAAGVLYTTFPTSHGNKALIQAVRGLGLTAVDGSAEPDTLVLDRISRKVLETKKGVQTDLLRAAPHEGTERVRLDDSLGAAPVLTPRQALKLADLGWHLESEFGVPLDLEWAIDKGSRLFILQVRPLSEFSSQPPTQKARVPEASVLVEKGARASRGAAAGPVFHVSSNLDILRCPAGSVVVVREANPRYAVLLPKSAAIVADMGEVTGHLATVARELHVPALFATHDATRRLANGNAVTVDADAGVIYAGRVDAAIPATIEYGPELERDPNREALRSVAALIIPLTLRDRLASGCSQRKCKTLHDIIRFCHQATVEAMFEMGDKALKDGRQVRRLVSAVPIDCRVFDFGGGLQPKTGSDRITLDEVVCRPMRMLWRGMTDPRLRWNQTRPVTLKGFMSAVVDFSFDLDARLRPMGEPSYAFLTSEYLNLNSRIGYHFSTVDARICETIESNYASFRFVGGSTGIEQRSRRARLIEHVLAACHFETDCRADLVNARFRHRPPEEMDEALFWVGLLMGFVNHLDMALVSDAVMHDFEDAFLRGDYGFTGEGVTGRSPRDTGE